MTAKPGVKEPITIFGAGIAGLTAAHELATRGFTVQVIDPDYHPPAGEGKYDSDILDRGIGGMARSQWAIDLNSSLSVVGPTMRRLWPGRDLLLGVELEFDGGKPVDPHRAAKVLDQLTLTLRVMREEQQSPSALEIRVKGVDPEHFRDDPRVVYLRDELRGREVPEKVIDQLIEPVRGAPSNVVSFECVSGTRVPAEHGFRFFPSFYRHLFDTMRRTPIMSPTDPQRTKATTFDNLVPSEGLGFARNGKAVSFMIPRHAISLEESRRILDEVLGQLGYTGADIARFSLKLFKYMTSSSARRAGEYERTSWGDFVESWRYSKVSREHIEYGPQMSAALRGSQSDARTQGNILIQLLLDQLKPESLADYTLSGPTSSYWLNHWHDFLLSEGVQFERGALVGFEARGQEIVPLVSGGPEPIGTKFVLALPLQVMAPLAEKFLEAAEQARIHDGLADMRKVFHFAGKLDLGEAEPTCPLQHLSGIQYYFDQDVRFWRGHTQYLDSEWGLTSIAQPQFWGRERIGPDQYRSILSVDIGIFDRAYTPKAGGPAKIAWECSADEIAQYAWEQIVDHHDDAFRQRYGHDAKIPTPVAYALDANLRFADGPHRPITSNDSPFLVNQTGAYHERPGRLETVPGRSKVISRYEVMLGKYVLAGTFMQTYTRLTSMEGANESARHAVNALLQEMRIPGDRCDIWDPEDHELDDLQWFKDLDQMLFERGLPHFTDILGWDELPDQLEHVHAMARAVRDGHRSSGKEAGR